MSLRPRKSFELDYPLAQCLSVRPVGGMFTELPSTKIPREASPNMSNCIVVEGRLRKRYGFSEYGGPQTAFPSAVVGLFSAQDEENNTHLIACHTAGVKKWNFGTDSWDDLSGPALTGTAQNWFSFEVSQNDFVFSQGVDEVMVHDLAGTSYAALATGNCPPARYLTRFANRLVIAYTVEGGDSKPFRIRRSVNGDHTDWTGVGAGFTDLSEFPHHIRQIKKIGSALAVYTEKSIQLGTKTEIAAFPFRIDPVDAGVGLFSARCVAEIPGDRHVILGPGNAYVFSGHDVQEIANQVRQHFFGTLNPSAAHQYFAVSLPETQEVLFFVASGDSENFPNKVWVYNYALQIWYPWDLNGAVRPRCCTLHRLDDTVTIDELVGTIDEQNWEFDARFLQAAHEALLTGHDDGHVYQWSAAVGSDNGAAIASHWHSKDFESWEVDPQKPYHMLTLRALGIVGIDTGGSDLNIEFSTDGGVTWSATQSVAFTEGHNGALIEKWVTYQVTGPRIRWRLRHNKAGQSFQIIEFKPVFEVREELIT